MGFSMKTPILHSKSKRADAPDPFSGLLYDTPLPGRAPLWYFIAIAAITAAAMMLRVGWLGHFLRYDEAFQFMQFASPTEGRLLFYQSPNNHVLHTILVRLAAYCSAAPEFIRLPALLTGVSLAPLAAMAARCLSGRCAAGVAAAALVACSSILVEYSVNARGYSMVCAATLGLFIVTLRLMRDVRPWRPWAWWIGISALGMLTVPVMAYPVGLMAVVIVAQALLSHKDARSRLWVIERTVSALFIWAVVTAALYLPVAIVTAAELTKADPGTPRTLLDGYHEIVANRFVAPVLFSDSMSNLGAALATTPAHWTRDMSALSIVLVLAGLAATAAAGVRRRWAIGLLPVLAPVLLILAAVLQCVAVFPRVWLFLLPLLLVLAACGLVDLASRFRLPSRPQAPLTALGLVLAAACLWSAWNLQHRPYLISEDPKTFVDIVDISRDLIAADDGATAATINVVGLAPLSYYCAMGGAHYLLPGDPQCRRLLVVTQGDEDPVALCDRFAPVVVNGQPQPISKLFGGPVLWKQYSAARIYAMPRLAKASSEGKN